MNPKSMSQPALKASLLKHGYTSHKIEKIDSFLGTIEEAHDKEMFWIRSFMCNILHWPEMRGMNLTDGGQGTIGWKADASHRANLSKIHTENPSRGRLGKKCSEEQKAKIRETMEKNGWIKPKKLKPTKEETRLKQSLAKKGKPAHNKGKPMPEHQKEILRAINTGRPSWNRGKTYSHLTVEERKEKFGKHNIGNNYNKGRKHSEQFCEQMRVNKKGVPNSALFKPVLRFAKSGALIGVYQSIKQASSRSLYSEWTIGNMCKGNGNAANKHIFKYKSA